MVIRTIKYQKVKNGKWHVGIRIEGNGIVNYLNKNGFLLDEVYDINILSVDLCIDIEPILNSIESKLN